MTAIPPVTPSPENQPSQEDIHFYRELYREWRAHHWLDSPWQWMKSFFSTTQKCYLAVLDIEEWVNRSSFELDDERIEKLEKYQSVLSKKIQPILKSANEQQKAVSERVNSAVAAILSHLQAKQQDEDQESETESIDDHFQ